jgi:capsule polysaccharide modification protein KpsS
VVVKRHPRCKDEGVQHLISKLQQEGKITVTKAPVHDILRKAKLVITVNSGVGFEALLHLLPVITTGGSEYHWVTRVVKKPTDLPKVLSWQPDPDLIKKFLYYYHNQYVYFQTDKDRFSSLLTSWGF